jgi:hypothetical protein
MPARLEFLFSNLKQSQYKVTSEESRWYNCVAFAAGETQRWWWPIGAYWPEQAPRHETIESFIVAFQALGYTLVIMARLKLVMRKLPSMLI